MNMRLVKPAIMSLLFYTKRARSVTAWFRAETGEESPHSGKGRELCTRIARVFPDHSTVPRRTAKRGATLKFNKTALDFKYARVRIQNCLKTFDSKLRILLCVPTNAK